MKYDTAIAVRLSSVEDRKLVDQINHYEGTSISDVRFLCVVCRAEYMSRHHSETFGDAVPEVMQA